MITVLRYKYTEVEVNILLFIFIIDITFDFSEVFISCFIPIRNIPLAYFYRQYFRMNTSELILTYMVCTHVVYIGITYCNNLIHVGICAHSKR